MSTKKPQSEHYCTRCGIVKPRHEMCISKAGRVQGVCIACSQPRPGMKWCSRCHKYEPVENFGQNRANPDGLASICRAQKARIDEETRYERQMARTEREDTEGAMQCEYCAFEALCKMLLSESFEQVRNGDAPTLGDTDELPCLPDSPRHAEYVQFVQVKRAAAKPRKRVGITNFVMTVTGD